MFAPLWNQFLLYPLVNGLIFLHLFTGSLALAIIGFTVALRVIMTPLVLPSLKLSKKMQELAPEIAEIKAKYKDDKQALLSAQSELYKKNGANPAAGCLPQIIQLVVLIALFQSLNLLLVHKNSANLLTALKPALYSFNQLPDNFQLSSKFLYVDLVKPDTIPVPGLPFPIPGVILLSAALVQFLSGKMMSPQISAEKKIAAKTEDNSDDAMVVAQQQMLYMMPLMTILFGFQFPSGLVLYWFVFSAVSMVQQYYVSGWGGLRPWLIKLNLVKS